MFADLSPGTFWLWLVSFFNTRESLSLSRDWVRNTGIQGGFFFFNLRRFRMNCTFAETVFKTIPPLLSMAQNFSFSNGDPRVFIFLRKLFVFHDGNKSHRIRKANSVQSCWKRITNRRLDYNWIPFPKRVVFDAQHSHGIRFMPCRLYLLRSTRVVTILWKRIWIRHGVRRSEIDFQTFLFLISQLSPRKTSRTSVIRLSCKTFRE